MMVNPLGKEKDCL